MNTSDNNNDYGIILMARAIQLGATKSQNYEGGPFGAVIALNGEIIAEGWNQVTSTCDPTAHAEIVAIRNACSKLKSFHLTNAILYTSCEPCPMCLAATYWAQISRIVYSATRKDAAAIGFDDSFIYDEFSIDLRLRRIPMQQSCREEAFRMMQDWTRLRNKTLY